MNKNFVCNSQDPPVVPVFWFSCSCLLVDFQLIFCLLSISYQSLHQVLLRFPQLTIFTDSYHTLTSLSSLRLRLSVSFIVASLMDVFSASLSKRATPESTGEAKDDVIDEVMQRPKTDESPHNGRKSDDTSLCCCW